MASSSTSSIPQSFTYDVFLSFRGEDTRKNFVDHLYHALQHKSINTFKDDKNLEKGERISTELIKAIEDSRFHIIVFSKNYASSSWCLDELVKIVECQKMTEHTAYPVFYDVEPTEVRKQTGAVGEAFFRHRNEVDAGKWREALKEAAGMSGWELKNFADGHEFPFIQTIVEEISQKLPFINSSVDENLVGMETRVDDIVSSLETSTVDDILMIGIKGIGGGGKTTLARAVFDQISSRFEGKSFVENVREVSKPDLSALKLLQEQVLSDVLNKGITVSGVHEGKKKMKDMMRGRKVLLVLDDVDHIDQLEALAGKKWFGPGSRIIVTTRDAQVLIAHEMNSIHDVNLLSNEEAIRLFNKFAFRTGEIPIPSFKLELSQQVVDYAAGLPLTIRVLGADLKDKDEGEWKDTIERLKKIPLQETLKKLELSYISLDEEQKNIFLDVACFWKGEEKDEAIRALESCELHVIAGLRVLERKSLITFSTIKRWNMDIYMEMGRDIVRLDMHDHIQEMGRDIVRRSHPDEPYRHSRLWIAEEIEDILAKDLGSEETRGIKLQGSWNLRPSIIMKGLNNMKKLQFLHVTLHQYFYSGSNDVAHMQYLPNTLQYLCWVNYPFSSFSITTSRWNLLQGGEGKVLKKLRFLHISWSSCLKTLDLGFTPNLETLSIMYCNSFQKLHVPIECLKFKSLDINNSKMTTLDLGFTPNLETLNIGRCFYLEKLHMPTACLKLKSLDINMSKLTTLDLGFTPNLETLSIEECDHLVELHMPAKCLKLKSFVVDSLALTILDLEGTSNLETLSLGRCFHLLQLHMPAKCLKLVSLEIWPNSKLMTLDLGGALNIETLSLEGCDHLVELHMPPKCLKLKSFVVRGLALTTLDLRGASNLEKLSLEECDHLVELQMPAQCLKLKSFEVKGSILTTLDLEGTSNLKTLSIEGCFHLVELHMPAQCLKLKFLDINRSKLTTLNLQGTPNLRQLCLVDCVDLLELHMPIEFRKLEFLEICGSKLRTVDLRQTSNLDLSRLEVLVDLVKLDINIKGLRALDLRCLGNLKILSLSGCYDLIELNMHGGGRKLRSLNLSDSNSRFMTYLFRKILLSPPRIGIDEHDIGICWAPDDLYQLQHLHELTLSSLDIEYLPNGICILKHLKSLKLESCLLLEKITEDLGRLECLEKLILSECGFLQDIPNNICKMKRLRCISLRNCFLIGKLPEELGQLECLEELNIEGTCISNLPQSIFVLKRGRLRIVGSRLLLHACGFTSEIQTSEDETFCYV